MRTLKVLSEFGVPVIVIESVPEINLFPPIVCSVPEPTFTDKPGSNPIIKIEELPVQEIGIGVIEVPSQTSCPAAPPSISMVGRSTTSIL